MNYQIQRNIPYLEGSSNPRQQLDIYLPENSSAEKLPAVVYFHGGGWEFGDKEKAIQRFENFYDTGYILIAVGYRLSEEASWPAPIDDAVAALKYVQTQMPEVDTERIALWGSSAGGHLACLLAGGCRNTEMPAVKCLVNYCAPVTVSEFVEHLTGEERLSSPVMKLLGGDHAETDTLAKEATVTNWVKPGYPPTLSIHGDHDDVVPIRQSQVLTEAILAAGSEVVFYVAKGSEHRVESEAVRREVKSFLSKYL